MTRAVIIVGLLAILTGLFLSKRSDQAGLGSHDEHCIDTSPPAVERLPASQSFFIEADRLLFHSGEVRL
jgi:hypothetical protein